MPHTERCEALARQSGERCPNRGRGVEQGKRLCARHLEHGAVIPEAWTQPDNLPVFALPVRA